MELFDYVVSQDCHGEFLSVSIPGQFRSLKDPRSSPRSAQACAADNNSRK
jgi:hypothetical protein